MSNDDNVEVWIDPEKEAKIVAMIMGELSAFEMAEMEEELSNSPELRLFQQRMLEVQGLICETQEQDSLDDAEWKLASDIRTSLLEKLEEPVREHQPEELAETKAPNTPIQWRSIISIAACLIVSLVLTAVVFPVKIFSRNKTYKNSEEVVSYYAHPSEEERLELIAQYKQKIEAQEDKVEDNRARLYKLSKSLGIPYHGINSQVASTYDQDRRRISDEKTMATAEDHTQFGKVKEEYEREFAILQSIKQAEFSETIPGGIDIVGGTKVKMKVDDSSNAVSSRRVVKKQASQKQDIVWASERIAKPQIVDQVELKPSSPRSSMAKIIAANQPSPTLVPVPEITVTEPALDFGNGDDFGDGWGAGGGSAEKSDFAFFDGGDSNRTYSRSAFNLGAEGRGLRSGDYSITKDDIDGTLNGLNANTKSQDIWGENVTAYNGESSRSSEKGKLPLKYSTGVSLGYDDSKLKIEALREEIGEKGAASQRVIDEEIALLEKKERSKEESENLEIYKRMKTDSDKDNKALAIRRQLQSAELSRVEFAKDATVKGALDQLQDQLSATGGKKLNITFRDRGVKQDSDVDGFADEGGFGDVSSIEDIKLGEMNLKNIPMEEVLRQVAQKTGLRYKVEDEGVVFMRATDLDDSEMYTRTFRVPETFKDQLKGEVEGDPFEEGDVDYDKMKVRELIIRSGIPMPEGSVILHSKDRGIITVRNTANNLDIIEELVAETAEVEKRKKIETIPKLPKPTPEPQTLPQETSAAEKADSTFSLNVSDVSFELARVALLEKAVVPEAARIRVEEFVNAFDYGDPSASGKKVTCAIEQCAHPIQQQRNLMRIGMKTGAIGRTQPLRLTILLDNSGSMEREDREATVLKAIEALASKLGPQDEVTLLSFARDARLVAQNLKGDEAGKLVQLIKSIPSEGGTNLSRAIQQAHFLAKKRVSKDTLSRVVLITDGAANLGNADPEELAKSIVTMRQDGVAFDACGVGADGLDDEMLEALTRKGDGRYYFINKAEDADAEFAQKLAGALRPAAKNVKVQVIFNPERVGNYRLLGFEKHLLKKEDFRNDTVDAAEMAAEEAGNALYQVEAIPGGHGDIGRVFVRFMDMETGQMVERSWTIPYDPQAASIDNTTPSMQLASVAGLLGEKMKFGESAGISLSELDQVIGKLRVHFHSDKKVQSLIRMVERTKR